VKIFGNINPSLIFAVEARVEHSCLPLTFYGKY
jgi:hypothetical protein